jgi:hypothetical protein
MASPAVSIVLLKDDCIDRVNSDQQANFPLGSIVRILGKIPAETASAGLIPLAS